MMTTTQIEVGAVAEIQRFIRFCPDLEPYLDSNDRTPVWDGDIYVYNPGEGGKRPSHNVNNLIRRIPAQVKGHEVERLSTEAKHSIGLEYIDAYIRDGAMIFFVVQLCGIRSRVFYKLYSVSELNSLKAQAAGQKTTTITLTDYLTEDNYLAFNDRLGEFVNDMPQQGDKSKVVKLDESLDISGILEEKKKDDAKYASAIIARAQRNEDDIEQLKSSNPSGWLDKIIALYRDTITGTEEYFERSEYARWLYNFALFLHDQRLYHLIDNLYDRALVIFRELEDLPHVALTLNNLAILHSVTNCLKEAEGEYEEALKIRRKLADANPSAYQPDVASTLNNLANLHSDTNRKEEAEGEYEEALKIYRKLAETNPSAYLPYVAATLNNLAILHKNTNRMKEAEGEYEEALNIYRELAKKNPSAYLPDVAMTLNNLAVLHKNTNRMEEAEGEYEEALKIRRELAEANPSAYLPDVATTLNNLAVLHKNTNRVKEAEGEYVEALKIRRQLAKTNPSAYLPDVASTLNNLGILYAVTDRFEEAEKLCQEALGIYQEFAKLVPSAYQPDLEWTLKILDWIKQNKRNGN